MSDASDVSAVSDVRRGQVVGLVAGTPLVVFGVVSLLRESSATHPRAALTWLVGAAVAHDLVLAPLVIVVATLLARLPLGRARAWVSGGLVVSGAVLLYAWPSLRGYGRLANNPSVLPRNYATGLVLTLGVVWGAVVVGAFVTTRRTRLSTSVAPERPHSPRAR